jgi:protein-S-isoprenylcysteine O-methyltransferase Ste14
MLEYAGPMAKAIPFRNTKLYDVLAASPLIILYVFALAGLGPRFEAAIRLRPFWLALLQLVSLAGLACYLALIIALILLRGLPVAKSGGVLPRLCAILGSVILMGLAFLPAAPLNTPLIAISALLSGAGWIAEIYVLGWLRRSFSLLPEARRLVMRGPYRRIRHPLYLAGEVISLGSMLNFEQPLAVLIALVSFAFQLLRMHYEEQILARTFPEYTDYMARTWRLVPGLY